MGKMISCFMTLCEESFLSADFLDFGFIARGFCISLLKLNISNFKMPSIFSNCLFKIYAQYTHYHLGDKGTKTK